MNCPNRKKYARTIMIAVTPTIKITLSVVIIAISWGPLHGFVDEAVLKTFGA